MGDFLYNFEHLTSVRQKQFSFNHIGPTYRDKKDQNGNPLKIIPIIIGKNLTIHQKSLQFLEELRVNFETIYEEIGYIDKYLSNTPSRAYVQKESSPTGRKTQRDRCREIQCQPLCLPSGQ
ncbi:Hypothetical_protein [Hexamita inflata]|uniref:Hypothetical_protein n=1 Tax=Hexamita inflata TaxID=28002 RepID=A0AA86Q0R8_9EUKA|nr:Hypothetical protein HINF_LOCUS37266 [Hexamita inflata]